MKAGADISLLKNSVAMELNPSMQEREKQVQPFLKLTESTQLLSPVLGTERYASLSSGHTCQFIKACMHGCHTEEEALGGVTGKLGTHVWEHDHDLKKMVEVGWEWVIPPPHIGCEVPKAG